MSATSAMSTLHRLHRGDSPLIVDVPHAGTYVPPELAARLSAEALAVPDTDWHVDKLYAFAPDAGATLLVATHSRIVVDLNRDPSGAALYPGADNTELCPTRTFDNAAIYAAGDVPGATEIAARRSTWFEPYHAVLVAEIERVRARHGYAVLLDGHSIRSQVPRFFAGRLPDLNLGTASGASCAPELAARAEAALAGAGFSLVVNGRFKGGYATRRFKGGYVTRRYGRPADGVHALQLEMAQCAYMDEAPPYPWDAQRAAPLAALLARLVDALTAWRPA